MRKYIRNNVKGLLETVIEGLQYAFTADEEPANAALADCLEAVNAAAGILEHELSPGRFAHYDPMLREAYVAIETLLTDIDDMNLITAFADRAFKALPALIGALDAEREIKTEVVFFPYKASMWDSLESIWKAAIEDESCFVSVVPIPYYDRDIYKNLASMHYEGADFPDYAHAIHYDEFSIETIAPDVAYIHNPYDGNNHVTSVHPSYYSAQLKKHVKTLVYVPYYASHISPTPAFAAPLAMLSADLMIASSKEDASAYRRAGAGMEIAALGSPKIDRIINMEKERPRIPEEWSGKLGGKKIFLLNTSVSSMLRFNLDYFAKIHALISLFETRGDAALLWRPHPLTMSTIDSMRPQFREAYAMLVEAAESSGSAVVDLTPDMGISMAISDAYIGDGASSLIYLYALTGKPLYQLNFTMPIAPTPEELGELLMSDLFTVPCFDGGSSWVFCNSVNALCTLDIETCKAVFVSSVPGEDNRPGLYNRPVKSGDSLLLPPVFAKEWAQYDTRTGEWTKLPVPDKAKPVTRNGACFTTVLDTDEYAIFAPVNGKAFAKYDKKTGGIEYYAGWYRAYEQHLFNIDIGHFGGCSELLGKSIYLTSKQSNLLLELNADTMNVKIHAVGDRGNRYFGITYDGSDFWLTKSMLPGTNQRQNAVVRWNKATGKAREFPLQPVTYNPLIELSDFGTITMLDGKVLALPYGVNEIFQIDPATEESAILSHGLPYNLAERKNPYYAYAYGVACGGYYVEDPGRKMTFSYYDNSILYFESGSVEVRKRKIKIEGIGHLLRSPALIPPYVRTESAFLPPGGFIDRVCDGSIAAFNETQTGYHRAVNANSDGTCGAKIHEFVMRSRKKRP